MSLALPPPEDMIVADHSLTALKIQKQIVEAARERPYYTFRNLVFLCWRRTRRFKFDQLDNLQLQAVLDDVREGVKVHHYTHEMEDDICNCSGNFAEGHSSRCAVLRFRKAIED